MHFDDARLDAVRAGSAILGRCRRREQQGEEQECRNELSHGISSFGYSIPYTGRICRRIEVR
jgi:hypothetical protein